MRLSRQNARAPGPISTRRPQLRQQDVRNRNARLRRQVISYAHGIHVLVDAQAVPRMSSVLAPEAAGDNETAQDSPLPAMIAATQSAARTP